MLKLRWFSPFWWPFWQPSWIFWWLRFTMRIVICPVWPEGHIIIIIFAIWYIIYVLYRHFYAFWPISVAILAAILDLKVKMTSFMNLSHANGFVMLMLVQNDAPLVKISDLIPEILLITNSKWPLAAILDFWPITGHKLPLPDV